MRAFLIVFISLLFSFNAYAESKNTMPTGNVPTRINADNMDYNAEKNLVVFKGDVAVAREEFNLWSDVLFVYLKDNSAQEGEKTNDDPMSAMKSGEIEQIVAEKNVRMKYNTNTGTCGKAIYRTEEALLIMQQDPFLKDGDNSITGEEIRYFMNENRSEVIGGKKRVEAFFSSKN